MELEPMLDAPRTADEDVRRAFLRQPTFEVRELLDWVAAFPVTVASTTPQPFGVLVFARESNDAEASVQCSVPSFTPDTDGVRIPAVTGLTAGTRYDLTILILGVPK